MKNKYEINDDTTVIFLKRKDGTVIKTIIDTEDLEKLMSHGGTWCAQWSHFTQSFYVVKKKDGERVMLHRVVTDCSEELVVDHINHDTLDNRKCNLRVVTQKENTHNRRAKEKQYKKGKYTPNFKGTIYWHKTNKYWVGRIICNGKELFTKCNKDIEIVKDALYKANINLLPQFEDSTLICNY